MVVRVRWNRQMRIDCSRRWVLWCESLWWSLPWPVSQWIATQCAHAHTFSPALISAHVFLALGDSWGCRRCATSSKDFHPPHFDCLSKHQAIFLSEQTVDHRLSITSFMCSDLFDRLPLSPRLSVSFFFLLSFILFSFSPFFHLRNFMKYTSDQKGNTEIIMFLSCRHSIGGESYEEHYRLTEIAIEFVLFFVLASVHIVSMCWTWLEQFVVMQRIYDVFDLYLVS